MRKKKEEKMADIKHNDSDDKNAYMKSDIPKGKKETPKKTDDKSKCLEKDQLVSLGTHSNLDGELIVPTVETSQKPALSLAVQTVHFVQARLVKGSMGETIQRPFFSKYGWGTGRGRGGVQKESPVRAPFAGRKKNGQTTEIALMTESDRIVI